VTGYSEQELADIQGQWALRFPPDLIDIYRERRTVIPSGFDWISTPATSIQGMLDWPVDGLLFDLQHNVLWLPEWGEKPARASEAEGIIRAAVAAAPRLIPVFGHRYIPETPNASGNPVFSVYQSDIIYYGANLEDYVGRETRGWSNGWPPIRSIPFWSQFAGD